MERHAPDCPYPGCFFCVMKETNPSKRRANVAKFFKELPSQNEDGQVRRKTPISHRSCCCGVFLFVLGHLNFFVVID